MSEHEHEGETKMDSIRQLADAAVAEQIYDAGGITLGELEAALLTARDIDASIGAKPVRFDNGAAVSGPHCFRGYYNQCAFDGGPDDEPVESHGYDFRSREMTVSTDSDTRRVQGHTVDDVLDLLESFRDRTFEGYKGGSFQFKRHTPFGFGHRSTTASARLATGVKITADAVTVTTAGDW